MASSRKGADDQPEQSLDSYYTTLKMVEVYMANPDQKETWLEDIDPLNRLEL